MSRVVYLNSLQALDAAIRLGSLKRAGAELGITAAAAGQRIKALEAFTGTPLLERGLSGVTPTAAAEGVANMLRRAFADLDQVAMRLNLDRDGPVRLMVDADFLTLWLKPRLPAFHAQFPGIHLAFLAEGDPAPPDLAMTWGGPGEVLMPDWLVPVVAPANLHRVTAPPGEPPLELPLEGMPLLHVGPAPGLPPERGWPDWVARYPLRRTGADRGFRYRRSCDALAFAAAGVGMALVPLALALPRLSSGELLRLCPELPLIPARNSWMLSALRPAGPRPGPALLADWLRSEAALALAALGAPSGGDDFTMAIEPDAR